MHQYQILSHTTQLIKEKTVGNLFLNSFLFEIQWVLKILDNDKMIFRW